MRKVLALGAAILFVGSVSVAVAQERLQSNQSGMGVGEGVGDVSGNSTRVNVFDRASFLERLSQAETVYGRVLAVDFPGRKLHLEGGGSSHDEGRAGGGAMDYRTVYFDDRTNMDQLKTIETGDDVIVSVFEETSAAQPFGTGRKLVREISVLRGNEKLAGFGGLGQRPNPMTERGINTNSGSTTGGVSAVVFSLVRQLVDPSPPRSASSPVQHLAGIVNRSQDGAIRPSRRRPRCRTNQTTELRWRSRT